MHAQETSAPYSYAFVASNVADLRDAKVIWMFDDHSNPLHAEFAKIILDSYSNLYKDIVLVERAGNLSSTELEKQFKEKHPMYSRVLSGRLLAGWDDENREEQLGDFKRTSLELRYAINTLISPYRKKTEEQLYSFACLSALHNVYQHDQPRVEAEDYLRFVKERNLSDPGMIKLRESLAALGKKLFNGLAETFNQDTFPQRQNSLLANVEKWMENKNIRKIFGISGRKHGDDQFFKTLSQEKFVALDLDKFKY